MALFFSIPGSLILLAVLAGKWGELNPKGIQSSSLSESS
jgi:hypothetical protein